MPRKEYILNLESLQREIERTGKLLYDFYPEQKDRYFINYLLGLSYQLRASYIEDHAAISTSPHPEEPLEPSFWQKIGRIFHRSPS